MGIINRDYIAAANAANENKIKDLSLLIGNDGFSFAIFSQEKELLALRDYRFSEENKLDDCLSTINKDNLLKSIFQKVNIATDSKTSALVPTKLYDQRFPERYLHQEDPLSNDEQEMIWIDEVEVIDGKNVHSVSIKLKNQLSDYFPGATFVHCNSILINSFARLEQGADTQKVFIHIGSDTCQTFYFDGNKLIGSSDFEFKSPNDFLYFVLLIFKNHNLDPEKVPLYISGKLEPKSLIYDKLYRYIRTIKWSEPSSNIKLGEYEESNLVHRDYELFALLS